jgi:hypothetical protein
MGLIMRLDRQNATVYADFPEAYWSIGNIVFFEGANKTAMVRFELTAYPSREAKYQDSQPATPDLRFGGPAAAYSTKLSTWAGEFPVAGIFPESIPTSVDEQKTALYGFVKQYLGLDGAIDA